MQLTTKELIAGSFFLAMFWITMTQSCAGPVNYSTAKTLDMTRVCIPDPSVAVVRCQAQTGTDCDTGALTKGAVIRVDCDTDAWALQGAAAVTAVANGMKVLAGVPEYFGTSTESFHWSFLSVSANGDCRIMTCM